MNSPFHTLIRYYLYLSLYFSCHYFIYISESCIFWSIHARFFNDGLYLLYLVRFFHLLITPLKPYLFSGLFYDHDSMDGGEDPALSA